MLPIAIIQSINFPTSGDRKQEEKNIDKTPKSIYICHFITHLQLLFNGNLNLLRIGMRVHASDYYQSTELRESVSKQRTISRSIISRKIWLSRWFCIKQSFSIVLYCPFSNKFHIYQKFSFQTDHRFPYYIQFSGL